MEKVNKFFDYLWWAIVLFSIYVILQYCYDNLPKEGEIIREHCPVCKEESDFIFHTAYGDGICPVCFTKEKFYICNGCQLAYLPDREQPDGYCYGCAETKTWMCSRCEERFAIEHMIHVGGGYYLCAYCAEYFLQEADPQIEEKVKEFSPFIPWPGLNK